MRVLFPSTLMFLALGNMAHGQELTISCKFSSDLVADRNFRIDLDEGEIAVVSDDGKPVPYEPHYEIEFTSDDWIVGSALKVVGSMHDDQVQLPRSYILHVNRRTGEAFRSYISTFCESSSDCVTGLFESEGQCFRSI